MRWEGERAPSQVAALLCGSYDAPCVKCVDFPTTHSQLFAKMVSCLIEMDSSRGVDSWVTTNWVANSSQCKDVWAKGHRECGGSWSGNAKGSNAPLAHLNRFLG